jgi:flavin reductase (DIM6/NTAB) family NADH-FMN oxidoreductase RutF
MTEIKFGQGAEKTLNILSGGAFLTTFDQGRLNTMTIGWGGLCFMWGKPVFMSMVRDSRFTWELIEKSGEFTVSAPDGGMAEALRVCGSESGRDVDKFKVCNLTARPALKIATPVVDCAGTHYECRTAYKTRMDAGALGGAIKGFYADGDVHTLYFGIIEASYTL